MIDARRLWKQRFQAEWRKRIRYLRYMFNDHLLVGLIIVLGGIAVMYERWAAALPDSFPYPAIAAVVFGWAAAAGSVRTLFREADTVFLLPAEERLGPYIQRAFFVSWLWQAYGLSLLLLLAGPLHARFSPVSWPLFCSVFSASKDGAYGPVGKEATSPIRLFIALAHLPVSA